MNASKLKRLQKLEQQQSDDEQPFEIVLVHDGDPEPVLDQRKNWIIVRGVSPDPKKVAPARTLA